MIGLMLPLWCLLDLKVSFPNTNKSSHYHIQHYLKDSNMTNHEKEHIKRIHNAMHPLSDADIDIDSFWRSWTSTAAHFHR